MDNASATIQKLKDIFADKSELPASDLIQKLELHNVEELEKSVADSRIYELSKDKLTVSKKSIIRFKLIVMKSETEVILPIARFIDPVLSLFGNIPYIRFNKTIGHLVVFEDDFNRYENTFQKSIKVTAEEGDQEFTVTFNEPNFDDRRSFSTEHSKHMEGILRHKYGKQTHFAVDGVTVYRNGIYLGAQKFKSVKELQSFFGKLLKSVADGQPVPEAEATCLKELLKFHVNSEKKLEEIDHFEVGFHPKFTETKCFLVVKKDGTKEDFSFNKCVKQIGNMIK